MGDSLSVVAAESPRSPPLQPAANNAHVATIPSFNLSMISVSSSLFGPKDHPQGPGTLGFEAKARNHERQVVSSWSETGHTTLRTVSGRDGRPAAHFCAWRDAPDDLRSERADGLYLGAPRQLEVASRRTLA
jgi:hypothetical protein